MQNDGLTALQYRTKDATSQQNNTHHRHTTIMSEIDHIFSKAKSSPVRSSSAKKRRKKNITKPAIPPSPPSSRKRPLPETVVDASHNSSGPSKRHKHVNDTNPNPRKSVKIGPAVDLAFKDSRGTSNRRYIAPGLPVYSHPLSKAEKRKKVGLCIRKTNLAFVMRAVVSLCAFPTAYFSQASLN